ncbi:MAG: hypothetical protein A2287_08690 [Candidatus Melainabacteria bacterium RIFOXYA12_FULL_32_12]|nr:MAG: hypothetical protein A2255_01395 [Candidatus Melainabacteria bacterium RIFOXYA2_FULL_32_9]OGI30457.1 MAG: hypothetical protein A2287_08690 [Candidatus Melainabacteria bacterium RIFOXYA12_FULL_32_12]
MWDLIVVGGGASGVAAAISAARQKCKTLLIEKMGFLGGTSTAALVTPMMRNMISNDQNLTNGIYLEVLERLRETGHAATHTDGNPGWFDPEMMKCVLDDLCEESGVEVLFDTTVTNVKTQNDLLISVICLNKSGFSELKAKYFIDTTGDADVAALAGVPFELGDSDKTYHYTFLEEDDHRHQALSLRFIMTNVDIEALGDWLKEVDPDSGISSVVQDKKGQILLTTAHTWEDKDWKLRPYFNQAVKDGVLKPEDGAYFQIFSIPGQKNAIAFNCPRIYSEKNLNPLNMWDISYAQKMGRKQIRRIAEFCKIYLIGFKEAYISQIAPQLGIRDSRRIEGIYKLTEEDIFNAKKFNNPAAKSNYPVDIHSTEKGKSELKFLPESEYYEIPVESLMTQQYTNLLVAGRPISATFRAEASLRIQPNCWALGETAGNLASEKIIKE